MRAAKVAVAVVVAVAAGVRLVEWRVATFLGNPRVP